MAKKKGYPPWSRTLTKAVYLLSSLAIVHCQSPCDQAPTASLRRICLQLQQADARAQATQPDIEPTNASDREYGQGGWAGSYCDNYTSLHECQRLGCVCPKVDGARCNDTTSKCLIGNDGGFLTKSTRKEYRTLSDEERRRFHTALRTLKEKGTYDQFVQTHASVFAAGSAHAGPGFLGWHRDFINKLELELVTVDPSVSLPYWDSTLDGALPNPADSVLFTSELMGDTDNGRIVSGPASDWRAFDGAPISRQVGTSGEEGARLLQESDLVYVLRQTRVENVMAYTAGRPQCPVRVDFRSLEFSHNNVHSYIGGHMGVPSVSANDPIFFMHHAFVDLIWELWRQQRQSNSDRENIYPDDRPECSNSHHYYRNTRQKLANFYTDELYQYRPRPSCSDVSCGSRFLFCDRSHGQPRCAAKVRIGGNCAGFVAGEDVCYEGRCNCFINFAQQQMCACVAADANRQFEPPAAAINNSDDERMTQQINQSLRTIAQMFRQARASGNEQDLRIAVNEIVSLRATFRSAPDGFFDNHPDLRALGQILFGTLNEG